MSDIIARGMAGKALKEIADIEVGGVTFSDTTPNSDTANGSAGVSNEASRGDHTHPTDTTRASAEELASLSEIVTDLGNAIEGFDDDITHLQEDIEEIHDTSIPAARDGLANLPILQFSSASDGDPTIELSYEYYDKESGEMVDGLSPLKLDQAEFEIQNSHLHIKDIYQNKLTAGEGITISDDNVISSTGGGGGSTTDPKLVRYNDIISKMNMDGDFIGGSSDRARYGIWVATSKEDAVRLLLNGSMVCSYNDYNRGTNITITKEDLGVSTLYEMWIGRYGVYVRSAVDSILLDSQTSYKLGRDMAFNEKQYGLCVYRFSKNPTVSEIKAYNGTINADIYYDKTTSGLKSTTLQGAIDELAAKVAALENISNG